MSLIDSLDLRPKKAAGCPAEPCCALIEASPDSRLASLTSAMANNQDRNFDDLADHFSRKIYGGIKGQIRLAVLSADLTPIVTHLMANRAEPLRVLDVGGGLGQLSIRFAQQGHHVTINDISPVMLDYARVKAREAGVEDTISWHCGPYQDLIGLALEPFDLVMCHAVLEWLQEPELLVPTLAALVRPEGYLSLCFYNPASIIYRNLIRGNFNWLQQAQTYVADSGSLTPNNPCSIEQVRGWMAQSRFEIQKESGLRVFSDYVVDRRGGHQVPELVLAMELQYSGQEPYKWMGRYLHVVAQK
ncbi:MAG: methyltransferase domain-containing protein [Pseudohongiella sp.]|nr:methyltransferase domain-containing protein [Pseudohongiella sp.]